MPVGQGRAGKGQGGQGQDGADHGASPVDVSDSVGRAAAFGKVLGGKGSARPGGEGAKAPAPWGAGRALPGLRPGVSFQPKGTPPKGTSPRAPPNTRHKYETWPKEILHQNLALYRQEF